MLGMTMAAQEMGMELPELFKHSTYERLMHFNLSTSQVPTKNVQAAFGPWFPDCYGVFYNPQEEDITVSVTAWKSTPIMNATRFTLFVYSTVVYGMIFFRFGEVLQESLMEMRGALSP